jgi:hypothetical protein
MIWGSIGQPTPFLPSLVAVRGRRSEPPVSAVAAIEGEAAR